MNAMRRVYAFIAGNSRVTPAGIALAVIAALLLRERAVVWSAPVYLIVLLGTLAFATGERVQ